MSPSHANKKGVRYRYYLSQALLQSHKTEAGSIARVSAPDVEALVCRAVKEAGQNDPETPQTGNDTPDHELICQHVERVIVHIGQIVVTLRSPEAGADESERETEATSPTKHTILFAPKHLPRKGIAHAPAEHGALDPRMQDTLLQAIARSRSWMDAVLAGKTASFDEIASAEGLAERHIRRLVPLAFLSPKIIQAIADGTAPAGLTVSCLTQALPHRIPASQGLSDATPAANAPELRAFLPRRQSVWNSENAWLMSQSPANPSPPVIACLPLFF